MKCTSLFLSDEETLFFVGPPLEEGPLPAFFYFSLSGEESLTLDPYNQPVAYLSRFPIRIFSLNLPDHSPGIHDISPWADKLFAGKDIIQPFMAHVEKALNFLMHRRCLIEDKIGVGGLSRGAFFAAHLAAHLPLFNPVLGFAPLTRIDQIKEIATRGIERCAEPLNLTHLIPSLLSKTLRFYIGNNDARVGTANCFEFVQALTAAKAQARHHLLDVEMIIKPSIGNKGHGTSKETFEEGALWLTKQLGLCDDAT